MEDKETIKIALLNYLNRDNDTASVATLQRLLKIGYAKAANMIDEMEERKIVVADEVIGKRKIVDKEKFAEYVSESYVDNKTLTDVFFDSMQEINLRYLIENDMFKDDDFLKKIDGVFGTKLLNDKNAIEDHKQIIKGLYKDENNARILNIMFLEYISKRLKNYYIRSGKTYNRLKDNGII